MGKIKEKKLQKKLKAVAKKQPPTKDDDEQPQKQSKQKQIKTKHVDVFEVEDTENVNELRKFEDIDVFDYELPSDFEDEEILSESDEELSSKTSKSTKSSKSASKTKKPLLREEDLLNEDIEDNENDIDMGEQEEDEEEDEYQNISDLLDEEPSSKPQKAPKSGRSKQHEEVEEDEEEEYSSQEDNDDEIDEGTHNKMLQSILDNKSKKKKKKEITETVPESEFNLKNTQEISMEDLMGTLNDVTGLADVKKQMAKLKKQKQLSEPLPKLVEDRLTREEATKKTDKDFEKWRDFSKELKHAPQLQFPLQEEEHTRLTTAQVVEEFHPITEMEKDIDQLLRATGVHKEQVEAADDLEHRMMTEDELQRKEVELAKMARLLFFQERKHKRQKKIKSKDYHRRLKKEREKNKLSLEELREIDPELAAQEEEKMLSKRIEERISLRHSKTKSQFSKHAIMHNEEARRAVQEQMEMKKQLLSKMNTMGNDEDASDPEEDAQKLQEEEDLVGEERKHSKLMNMRFMQKGFEKEHATGNSAINMDDYEPSQAGAISAPLPGVIKEKNAAPQDWKVDAAETVPVPAPVVEKQTKKGKEGKTLPPETTFAPEKTSSNQDSKSAKNKKSSEPVLNSKQVPTQKASKGKEASIQIQDEASEQTTSEQPAKKNKSSKNNNKKDEDESNPWIAPENATKKVSQENKRMTIKSQERAKKKNEGTVQIKMENAINLDNLDKKVKKADKFDLNANSSTEQQDLISQAFTTEGVDYEAEFQALKQKEIQEELPEMENTELPGWGSWGGIGVSFSQQRLKEKRLQEKQKKFEAVLNELQKRRDDYTLGNVILNNGMTKQQTKYTVPTIPKNHTPVSYEKTLLMPLGREWNTTSNFQNNIKPKVDVKEGVAIQPVSMDTVKRHEESLVKKEKLLKRQIGAANAKPEKVPPKKKARSASSKL